MSARIAADEDMVTDLLAGYRDLKAGQRGIDAYLWFIDTLRAATGAHSVAIIGSAASAVLTLSSGAAVLHCLQGDLDQGAEVIAAARSHDTSAAFRGLALPGDRLTKNLFEEARMPAQMLLH